MSEQNKTNTKNLDCQHINNLLDELETALHKQDLQRSSAVFFFLLQAQPSLSPEQQDTLSKGLHHVQTFLLQTERLQGLGEFKNITSLCIDAGGAS